MISFDSSFLAKPHQSTGVIDQLVDRDLSVITEVSRTHHHARHQLIPRRYVRAVALRLARRLLLRRAAELPSFDVSAEKGGVPEVIRESQRRRYVDVETVDKVIALDKQWREGETPTFFQSMTSATAQNILP